MSAVMGDPKTVLEGSVKYRDKKKWKSRWAVVSKLSPVADCLHIQLYRDSKERCKNGPTKASLSLEDFVGLETGFTLDKESNTMALICAEIVVVLAFDNRELLIQWQVKIRANLVEEQQFLVQIAHVPPKSKLPCGPARLHLQDHSFCLVSSVPPRLLGTWPIKELRRFGPIEGKFCFEGGSLCGKGEGLHVLLTNQCEELSQSMDLASKGKLLGKRKTLTRKNSMLESSSRMPLHKRCHLDSSSSKSTTGDSSSCRPLLSSGSECSTCDACSEILRSTDADELVYSSSSASMKASSCRIHYRWPSCLSRWGQSSTTTSDVDSVDTVSVILSDFQGSSQSATMSKSNGHGQSLSCLCDTQGTWPFNQCTKCGRQFYSRGSLQSCKGKPTSSPGEHVEDSSGFSPQWTMDSLVGSTNGKKESSSYQKMTLSDRASLCSRASHSSSASAASSSGSEYSVPKNFMDALYDKPKNMQHAINGFPNGKPIDLRRNNVCSSEAHAPAKPSTEVLCPCHEPIQDWMSSSMSSSQERLVGHPDCACWNKLSLNSRKSASANPSPSSSPKKSRYNTGGSNSLRFANDCECACDKGDTYSNYAVPRSAVVQSKDVSTTQPGLTNGGKNGKMYLPATAAEDYDVPKKFADLLSNCDMTQKSSAMKSIRNGPSCSCMSACKIVQNIELFKMASNHSYAHKHGSPSQRDALQMCACQRVMLWAGNLVPCLGPQTTTLETGWQCTKSLTADASACSRTWFSQTAAVCSEPHRTAEAVMSNGKVKHVLRSDSAMDSSRDINRPMRHPFRPRANTVSYPLTAEATASSAFNYANIEFSPTDQDARELKVTDDSSTLNYANIEFVEALPLYENSNLVLSRMESEDKVEAPCQSKPPLPPRAQMNVNKVSRVLSSDSKENVIDKCQCKQSPINRSPNKTALKQVNGSAYEMMCYEKNTGYNPSDEDYLLMQPLCMQEDNTSPSKKVPNKAEDSPVPSISDQNDDSKQDPDAQSILPLRPFMPFSYPVPDNINSSLQQEGISGDSLLRKNQLINEDLHLRAMRSNSLSELKKKVLMRKRSSSVDGKNNGYLSKDSGTESVPASPASSPRPSVQRKNSLFSKLNLRSKEKSMSTNEITLPLPVPNENSCALNSFVKGGLHRSADCLKLNEDFTNSDEDLNSDNSDFVLQKDSCHNSPMKRSRSVPCRAAMPTVSVSSPVRANETIMELNDLNKEESVKVPENVEIAQEPAQRKYSLDSHERSKQRVTKRVGSNCDNMYRQECLDESDTVMEMQGVLRRNHIPPSERGHVADNYRSNTSSCSSSDISDYMESLSFISRSSSSSSGSTSSADYMRSEEIYLLKSVPRPPPKTFTSGTNSIAIPSVHQSRLPPTDVNHTTKHRSFHDGCDASSLDTSSSGSSQDSEDLYLLKSVPRPPPRSAATPGTNNIAQPSVHQSRLPSAEIANKHRVFKDGCETCSIETSSSSGTFQDTARYRAKEESSARACSSARCSNRDSRSSTSSTSSLSTSPSVTDYSSSTSSSPPCQNNLAPKLILGKRRPEATGVVQKTACSCSEKESNSKAS